MKISVLTTVYNGEKYIEETILNVLNQTFKDFEWVIVDDNSTDKTQEIILKYRNKDKRIVYIKKVIPSFNQGYYKLHEAINFGLSQCTGDYIARIDADDLMDKHRLEIQSKFLDDNKDIFLVGSSANVIDTKSRVIGQIRKRKRPDWWYKLRIAYSNPFIHSSIMFRNKGYEYPNHNEHFFYFNLLINKKVLTNLPLALIDYRINPEGMVAQHGNTKNRWRKYYDEKP